MLQDRDFQDLAEFRYQIRRYLRFTEEESRKAGIEPQQYLLLICMRGMPDGMSPTLTNVAERLQLKHNSVVELVDRCVEKGLVTRSAYHHDKRTVVLALTEEGKKVMEGLAVLFHKQMRQLAPEFLAALLALVKEERTASKS